MKEINKLQELVEEVLEFVTELTEQIDNKEDFDEFIALLKKQL